MHDYIAFNYFVIPTTLLPVIPYSFRIQLRNGLGFDPAAVCCSLPVAFTFYSRLPTSDYQLVMAVLEKWVPYSQRYLFNAIPDTNHNANPTKY